MKTIGLIGGMTWVSTLEYYRIINETVKKKLGGAHSANCILHSVDFDEFILQNVGYWDVLADALIGIAKKLEAAGADFIIVCANTMHIIADDIQNNVNIPLLNIIDATAERIVEEDLEKVGLLGTKYTMEEDFFKTRLRKNFNIETIIPGEEEREIIHNVIINELAYEIFLKSSREKYVKIIDNLISNGAEAIILGCTEIPLLIGEDDVDIRVFDTTTIHAKAAVDFALK
jgi:aspartate racemase